jgi:hypothetical protein
MLAPLIDLSFQNLPEACSDKTGGECYSSYMTKSKGMIARCVQSIDHRCMPREEDLVCMFSPAPAPPDPESPPPAPARDEYPPTAGVELEKVVDEISYEQGIAIKKLDTLISEHGLRAVCRSCDFLTMCKHTVLYTI